MATAAVQQQQNVPPPPYDGYSPRPDQAQPPPGIQATRAPVPPNTNGVQTTTPQP